VNRMVKLLSANRFETSNIASEPPIRRAFEMRVTETHVVVPEQVGSIDVSVGDIWMLAAGETPTIGHPSHPAVADVTGHQIACELKILVPVPDQPN
jgi:hypothetical protein